MIFFSKPSALKPSVASTTRTRVDAGESLLGCPILRSSATDKGIMHRMKALAPHKTFLPAPTGGSGATCKSCAACPWMAMSSMARLVKSLETGSNAITLDPDVSLKAKLCIDRMLDFTQGLTGPAHTPHLGSA